MFWNTQYCNDIKLQPGEIRSQKIYHTTSMPFMKFLKSVKLGYGPGASLVRKSVHLFGKSGMLALEEVINANAEFPIEVAYEINREFGCYLSSKKATQSIGHLYQVTSVNNV